MSEERLFVTHDDDGENWIILANDCKRCNGKGRVVDYDTELFSDCGACAGTGSRLTYAGQTLIEFVNNFADHPDRDAEDLQ